MITETARSAADKARQAIRFLSSEVRGLQAAASVLALSALLSSVLALARDRYLAHVFGASDILDMYYASFRIPDMIFVAMGAMVSVYMMIPELSKRDDTSQRSYIDTIVAGFSLLAIIICSTAAYYAPVLIRWFFPEIQVGESADTMVTMTRIMLLQPVFLGFSNILAAITQSRYRYSLYAVTPLLYNIGIIFGIGVLYPITGVSGLAWGVVIGAFLHMAVQLPSVVRDGFLTRIPRIREPRALLTTIELSLPRALTLSMTQVTVLGLTIFAGILIPGSISVFTLAFNLQSVPLAIIGASYSVAAFPTLAAAFSKGERSEFVSQVAIATRYVLFWSMPAIALIVVLRAHIVRVILGTGSFDWTDTRLTAAAFALFSLSLAAQGIILLIIRGYYAAQRTIVPFVVTLCMTVTTLVLSSITIFALEAAFVREAMESTLRVSGLPGTSVLGIPFVYSIVTIVGCIFLMVHFEHQFSGYFARIRTTLAHSLFAAAAAGSGAYVGLAALSPMTDPSSPLLVFFQGFTAGLFGIIIATFAYYGLATREYAEVVASVRARIWRGAAKEGGIVSSGEERGTI